MIFIYLLDHIRERRSFSLSNDALAESSIDKV